MSEATLPNNILTGPHQTGRALIGWMTANEAKLWLSGRRADLLDREEYEHRAEQARAAVAARPAGLDQTDIRVAAPPELNGHIAALRQNATSAQFFNDGWEVSIIDLSKVCAAQPHINTGQSTQRVEGLQAQDLARISHQN